MWNLYFQKTADELRFPASSRRSKCIYLDTMKPDLHTASNGFLILDFGDYDSQLAVSVSDFLEKDGVLLAMARQFLEWTKAFLLISCVVRLCFSLFA